MKSLLLLCFIASTFAYNCTIFNGFPQTEKFVCQNTSALFQSELLASGRDASITAFLNLFSQEISGVNQTDKDVFLLAIMKLLVVQTATNPAQYVSHGTDHAVRVMQWANDLYAIAEVQQGMNNSYGSNGKQAQLLLSLLGLLHDVGYGDLDKHSVPKWLHAVSSGKMVTNLLGSTAGHTILAGLSTRGNVAQDWIQAIATHNFDDGFCLWTENNPQYASQCTFTTSGNVSDPSSPTTPLLGTNVTYVRRFEPASASNSPFSFVVRVADNFDAVRSRLTPTQNSEQLMQYFLRLYQDQPLRQAVGDSSPNYATILNDARQRAITAAGIVNPPPELDLVIKKATEQSWLHFYSNWVIDDSSIDSEDWSIHVDLYTTNNTALNFASHPGPGLYQINRLASSAYSCYISGNVTFLDLIRFNFNMPLPGLGNGNFMPLKAFTKKPVYDQNGPAKWDDGTPKMICDPLCAVTAELSLSPEPVLDTTGTAVADFDNTGFSKIPPFTDLTYNLPTGDTSSPTAPEKPADKTLLILTVLFASLVAVLLVILGVISLRSRKRSGYERINTK